MKHRTKRCHGRRLRFESLETRQLLSANFQAAPSSDYLPADVADASAVFQFDFETRILPIGDTYLWLRGDANGYSIKKYSQGFVPDTNFGEDGVAHLALRAIWLNDLMVQPDGSILLVGRANQWKLDGPDSDKNFLVLLRLTPGGALDGAFGNDGELLTNIYATQHAKSVMLQSDGKIIVAGNNGDKSVVARFTADGVLDETFGNGGKVTVAGSGNFNGLRVLDNRIQFRWRSYDGTESLEMRLERDGALDDSYDGSADFGKEPVLTPQSDDTRHGAVPPSKVPPEILQQRDESVIAPEGTDPPHSPSPLAGPAYQNQGIARAQPIELLPLPRDVRMNAEIERPKNGAAPSGNNPVLSTGLTLNTRAVSLTIVNSPSRALSAANTPSRRELTDLVSAVFAGILADGDAREKDDGDQQSKDTEENTKRRRADEAGSGRMIANVVDSSPGLEARDLAFQTQ